MSIYFVEARIKPAEIRRDSCDPHATRVHWQVCYRIDRTDAELAQKTCEIQRDHFLEELTPIWNELEELESSKPDGIIYNSAARARQTGNKSFRLSEAYKTQIEDWRRKKEKLRTNEAEITSRWTKEMLDPFFPTSTDGSPPDEVTYHVIELLDDPREIGEAELMKRRALLHAPPENENENDDEFTSFDYNE